MLVVLFSKTIAIFNPQKVTTEASFCLTKAAITPELTNTVYRKNEQKKKHQSITVAKAPCFKKRYFHLHSN